jgi:hypothetical protein
MKTSQAEFSHRALSGVNTVAGMAGRTEHIFRCAGSFPARGMGNMNQVITAARSAIRNFAIFPNKNAVFSCNFRLSVVIFASQKLPCFAGSKGATRAGVSF